MQQQTIIISEIKVAPRPTQKLNRKKSHQIRLFSMLVMIGIIISMYSWISIHNFSMKDKSYSDLKSHQIIDLIQYDTKNGFQDVVLKLQIYKIPLIFYKEANILLCVCIILTFPMVINFIERQSSTSIAFFQYNLNAVYLFVLTFGLDFIQYYLVGRCLCLQTGAAAIWINHFTKIVYYNLQDILKSKMRISLVLFSFSVTVYVIIVKNRLDLLIGMVISLIDILFLQGGTIKYPKSVLKQKEQWAQAITVDKWSIWQKFDWNQFSCNEQLCVDSYQYYITRRKRENMINN